MASPFQVLCVSKTAPDLATSPFGPFTLHACASLEAVALQLRDQPHDAVLLYFDQAGGLAALVQWPALSHAVLDAAVVAVAPEPLPQVAAQLLQLGLQDVLPSREAKAEMVARSLRLGIERKRIERAARRAYATDLATGLPNHPQLLEHMTHLLALREREPAPMALLALRIEGLAAAEAQLGAEAVNVLRRKVAVRLRAGLRASDVVASIGVDAFAVLLAWIDAPTDGERVASKLAQQLQQPFNIAGHSLAVRVNVGLSLYPENGKDADGLLRRALGQATSVATLGRGGQARRVERGPARVANDEGPAKP